MSENTENKNTKRTGLGFLFDVIKGVTLGVSAAIPGLSGGTIAVAEGCYDPLISSISSLRKKFKTSFLFLLPYILGLLLGALAAFVGIKKGYAVAPFSLTGLFAGMVAGSLPVALSELKKGANGRQKILYLVAFLFCFLLAAALGVVTALCKIDLASFLKDRAWWMYIFVPVAGFLAAFAFIIPGISGSMTLMILGMYYPILYTYMPAGNSATALEKSMTIWSSDNSAALGSGIILLVLLAIGAIAGVIASSKAMGYLLKNRRVPTFCGILGLILGSLISMFINSDIYPKYLDGSIQTWDYIVGSILFLIGGIAVYMLIRFTNKKQQNASESEGK